MSAIEPYRIMSYLKWKPAIGSVAGSQSFIGPLKIAQYTTQCTFWRKIEILEYEAHRN